MPVRSLLPLMTLCTALLPRCTTPPHASELPVNLLSVPEGFTVSLYAWGIENARSMVLSDEGILYVGTRKNDKVFAVLDTNNDNTADRVEVVARGLRMPNGVAIHDGDLYVAEVSRVLRYSDIDRTFASSPEPVVVNDSFPDDKWHGWKFIRFGPDSLLYVPVGAPCNVCLRDDSRYASIMRMRPDGSGLEVFASGIRNTVGFDWHPQTGVLWFTDNGRDWMGDNRPPDELNRAPREGMHFGFPFCHGRGIADPEFGERRGCEEFAPPAQELGPHVAALGMRFYTGSMFPPSYRDQIFIAEHGSWNRSEKIGYRLMLARVAGPEVVSLEVFAEGWLQGEKAWGRPVDVLVMPDGALLVSDDRAGAIYRIAYQGSAEP